MKNKYIENAIKYLNKKKIIAYPTESVFGLGCDPDCEIAVNTLLKLKQRSIEKGFILISNNYQNFKKYINDNSLTEKQKKIMFSTWPGHITWTIQAKITTPKWLTGKFDTLAIRIINYEPIKTLCNKYGKPIISTSANLNGQKPCKTKNEVIKLFKNIYVIDGLIGGSTKQSEIRNSKTGEIYRKG
ncbi:Sua5/YciO/YrdC/YwlC family protein [Candidatus Providencia siddallii]|uniref:Threonylcarbamoyl-AMP synthase n=1 Tax=Candidatus Providencia siddallii TaxID=1715285 RepID=A0ABM9NNR2_9GAMM